MTTRMCVWVSEWVCARSKLFDIIIIIRTKLGNFMCADIFLCASALSWHGTAWPVSEWMLPFILLPFSWNTIPTENVNWDHYAIHPQKTHLFFFSCTIFPNIYFHEFCVCVWHCMLAHGLWWLFPLSAIIIIILIPRIYVHIFLEPALTEKVFMEISYAYETEKCIQFHWSNYYKYCVRSKSMKIENLFWKRSIDGHFFVCCQGSKRLTKKNK